MLRKWDRPGNVTLALPFRRLLGPVSRITSGFDSSLRVPIDRETGRVLANNHNSNASKEKGRAIADFPYLDIENDCRYVVSNVCARIAVMI